MIADEVLNNALPPIRRIIFQDPSTNPAIWLPIDGWDFLFFPSKSFQLTTPPTVLERPITTTIPSRGPPRPYPKKESRYCDVMTVGDVTHPRRLSDQSDGSSRKT